MIKKKDKEIHRMNVILKIDDVIKTTIIIVLHKKLCLSLLISAAEKVEYFLFFIMGPNINLFVITAY